MLGVVVDGVGPPDDGVVVILTVGVAHEVGMYDVTGAVEGPGVELVDPDGPGVVVPGAPGDGPVV